MEQKTNGIVISVKKQWWLKINTKPMRNGSFDGAIFPHVIKVKYIVNNKEYFKRIWLGAGKPTPSLNSNLTIIYQKDKPSKAKIELTT